MRTLLVTAISVLVCGCAGPVAEDQVEPHLTPVTQARIGPGPELKVAIEAPHPDLRLTSWERSVEVEGRASIFGGLRFLDLVLVLDTSKSLVRTDPLNYRSRGAIGLVESLPMRSDVRVGVVDFDRSAELLLPLTADRNAVVESLAGLDRAGSTDLAKGILGALDELDRAARPDSSRVILLFTDGKTNPEKARRATEQARRRGVAIHTLLLGSSKAGAEVLRQMSGGTGASFIHVTDPERLPEAFLSLRTTGVDSVTLRVNDSAPIPARLAGGSFGASVPLRPGKNSIVATATSLGGAVSTAMTRLTVTGPMSLEIETPTHGALFKSGETEVLVEGSVNAFANLPPGAGAGATELGIQSVVLEVNGSRVPATVNGRRFRGRINLPGGKTRIVAVARSRDGRSTRDAVTVTAQSPGCAELHVAAMRDGKPALSISDRFVELVFDASNSMWGRIDGKPKIEIARDTLQRALEGLPREVTLALRVYGHQHKRELRRCDDSKLLVPFDPSNRGRIRAAIGSFRPRGQTPLAYSLEQLAGDFGAVRGERAVVLVTDGIESCGGNPEAAARKLQKQGDIPVHVIGFGLGNTADEDPASLKAIARVSGGRFFTADSADELRDALAVTVGTSFRVFRGNTLVAWGALGRRDPILLPAGGYQVRLESRPPVEVPVTLTSEQKLTLVLDRGARGVTHRVQRAPARYASCEDPTPRQGAGARERGR